MLENLRILDCTIRDGGYYNDWDFSPGFVSEYLSTLDSLGISKVELGFRFLTSPTHRGAWAYTPDSLVNDANPPKGLEVGVMIDLKEAAKTELHALENFFPKPSRIDFVRIASRFEELDQAKRLIPFFHSIGLQVGLNLMQASERSISEINFFGSFAETHNCDFAYLADSLGGLTPEKTAKLFSSLSSWCDIPLGIHAHDNRGLALQNTLSAVDAGASLLDSTMAGMGRGAGNTATEDLVAELAARNLVELQSGSLQKLNNFLNTHMRSLKKQLEWGPSLPYRLASYWGIHPTFVQELERDQSADRKVIEILEKLRNTNSSTYDVNLLADPEESKKEKTHVTFRTNELLQSSVGKNVVIVGGGDSANQHRKQIERFAKQNNCSLLLLNNVWAKGLSLENVFRVASKRMPEIQEKDDFWTLSGNKIVSEEYSAPSGEIHQVNIAPFHVKEGEISVTKDALITPNNLTLSYALAVALYLEASVIHLAGIDGYEDTDSRNSKIRDTLQIMRKSHPTLTITSLTSTKFSIPFRSPYWSGIPS